MDSPVAATPAVIAPACAEPRDARRAIQIAIASATPIAASTGLMKSRRARKSMRNLPKPPTALQSSLGWTSKDPAISSAKNAA